VTLLAPGDLTQKSDLPVLGSDALGVLTTFHYAVSHGPPENAAVVVLDTKLA
jgi:branched-chain amino acid transport system substrate-binding protein